MYKKEFLKHKVLGNRSIMDDRLYFMKLVIIEAVTKNISTFILYQYYLKIVSSQVEQCR